MRSLSTILLVAFSSFVLTAYAESPDKATGSLAKSHATSAEGCYLAGFSAPTLGVAIGDQKGAPIARFGGVSLPISVREIPAEAEGRLHLTTGASRRVTVAGFVDGRSLPLYLKRDTPVVAGQVSIAQGTRVEFAGRRGGELRVRLSLSHPLVATLEAWVPCEAVSLEAPKSDQSTIGRPWRGYSMKRGEAQLFAGPEESADVAFTLRRASDVPTLLLFGDRRKGNRVHVLLRSPIVLDGWMELEALEPLPPGELVDQMPLTPAAARPARLSVSADAKLYRASTDLPLYGKADPKLPPIGIVPKDAEVYVLDVVVGWASVLPKQLDVVPLEDRRFWVRASELGL